MCNSYPYFTTGSGSVLGIDVYLPRNLVMVIFWPLLCFIFALCHVLRFARFTHLSVSFCNFLPFNTEGLKLSVRTYSVREVNPKTE